MGDWLYALGASGLTVLATVLILGLDAKLERLGSRTQPPAERSSPPPRVQDHDQNGAVPSAWWIAAYALGCCIERPASHADIAGLARLVEPHPTVVADALARLQELPVVDAGLRRRAMELLGEVASSSGASALPQEG